jgi:hypothetical protein
MTLHWLHQKLTYFVTVVCACIVILRSLALLNGWDSSCRGFIWWLIGAYVHGPFVAIWASFDEHRDFAVNLSTQGRSRLLTMRWNLLLISCYRSVILQARV